MNKLNSKGDTIIEVLVVLAVLGFAIGIAYATASRSLLNTRQAQENSFATDLAQSQIESLRKMSANNASDPNYIFSPALINNYFCVDSSNNITTGFNGTNLFNYSNYPSVSTSTQESPPLTNPCLYNSQFYVSIYSTGNSDDTFTVRVIWDDVSGNGQDSVTLDYRVHAV